MSMLEHLQYFCLCFLDFLSKYFCFHFLLYNISRNVNSLSFRCMEKKQKEHFGFCKLFFKLFVCIICDGQSTLAGLIRSDRFVRRRFASRINERLGECTPKCRVETVDTFFFCAQAGSNFAVIKHKGLNCGRNKKQKMSH